MPGQRRGLNTAGGFAASLSGSGGGVNGSRRRQDGPRGPKTARAILKRNRLLESVEVPVALARRSVNHETLDEPGLAIRVGVPKARQGRFAPEGSWSTRCSIVALRMATNQFLGLLVT